MSRSRSTLDRWRRTASPGQSAWSWGLALLVAWGFGCHRSEPAETPRASPVTTRTAASQPDDNAVAKLYGTWWADDVNVSFGTARIKLVFKENGPMRLAAWSNVPLVGQVRDKTGPYEVDQDSIHSAAIRGGTSVKYWFEGDQLVIEYKPGQTVYFHRP